MTQRPGRPWRQLTSSIASARPAAGIGSDEAGAMDGLALGWVVMAANGHTPLIMQKSGGGGGFVSYIAPGREVGIFVAVNRAVNARRSSMMPGFASALDSRRGPASQRSSNECTVMAHIAASFSTSRYFSASWPMEALCRAGCSEP
jgi:hypothetical protein